MALNTLELKAARIRRGISQKEIAEALGTVVSNYSQKENGHTAMSVSDADKIARKLKLSGDEVMNIFFAN